jgi:hypothetical protein
VAEETQSASRNIPTSTARSVRSSSQSIRSVELVLLSPVIQTLFEPPVALPSVQGSTPRRTWSLLAC